jgi:hypothetical protein
MGESNLNGSVNAIQLSVGCAKCRRWVANEFRSLAAVRARGWRLTPHSRRKPYESLTEWQCNGSVHGERGTNSRTRTVQIAHCEANSLQEYDVLSALLNSRMG